MEASSIKLAVERFLCDLERIESEHEELTDTDVREAIHCSVNEFIVWGRTYQQFPTTFGMFSSYGDQLVADAFRIFLTAIRNDALLEDIPVGEARLNALQGAGAKSRAGAEYDEYLGHRDTPLAESTLPSWFFEPGDYED